MLSMVLRKTLFSKYLRDRLVDLRMEPDDLKRAFCRRMRGRVQNWIDGVSLPPRSRVPAIAVLLELDPLASLPVP